MLKFYYAPQTCALASHIALEEAGAKYEPVRIDFKSAQQTKPEYLAVNPKGRVPALATERGIITETPAILAYVAQSFPAARLAPLQDAFDLARVQAFTSYLCSTVHVAHAHRMRGYRWAPLVWAVGAPFAFVTPWLRMAADKHWFTDVLVGAAAGAAIGFALPFLAHHPARVGGATVRLVPQGAGAAVAGAW